jgi:hypothetical protein
VAADVNLKLEGLIKAVFLRGETYRQRLIGIKPVWDLRRPAAKLSRAKRENYMGVQEPH